MHPPHSYKEAEAQLKIPFPASDRVRKQHITPDHMYFIRILYVHRMNSGHKPAHIQHPCHKQSMLSKHYITIFDQGHVSVGRKYEMEMYVICRELFPVLMKMSRIWPGSVKRKHWSAIRLPNWQKHLFTVFLTRNSYQDNRQTGYNMGNM
jgi:hypothetical protein